MGKRKAKRAAPKKPPRQRLETTFSCPFCNHEGSIECKLDRSGQIGSATCRVCSAGYQTIINYLSEAVDVYSEWLDAIEAQQVKRRQDQQQVDDNSPENEQQQRRREALERVKEFVGDRLETSSRPKISKKLKHFDEDEEHEEEDEMDEEDRNFIVDSEEEEEEEDKKGRKDNNGDEEEEEEEAQFTDESEGS